MSQSSLGMLYWNQGANSRAERHLFRALRFAKKYHLRQELGVVNHELFVVRVTTEQYEHAEAFAQAAFQHYMPNHPRLPHLAYDLAYYWLVRGYARRALPLLSILQQRFTTPAERIQVLAAVARAAGAVGDQMAFDAAAGAAEPLLKSPDIKMTRAAALVDLGLGAGSLGHEADAERWFLEAAQAAEAIGQHDTRIRAEEYLANVQRGSNPETPLRPSAITARQMIAEQLASSFLEVLSR